jgi:hypothetical protein
MQQHANPKPQPPNLMPQAGSFYRGSGPMLQSLIPSGAFIAGFCIRGEQELISCSKGDFPAQFLRANACEMQMRV